MPILGDSCLVTVAIKRRDIFLFGVKGDIFIWKLKDLANRKDLLGAPDTLDNAEFCESQNKSDAISWGQLFGDCGN